MTLPLFISGRFISFTSIHPPIRFYTALPIVQNRRFLASSYYYYQYHCCYYYYYYYHYCYCYYYYYYYCYYCYYYVLLVVRPRLRPWCYY